MPLIKHNSGTARLAAPFNTDVRNHTASKTSAELPTTAHMNAEHDDSEGINGSFYLERIAELEDALRKAAHDAEAMQEAAFERGRTKGLEEAEDNSYELFTLLETALTKAHAAIGEKIDRQRDVAVALTRAILAEIFADQSIYPDMVASVARRWSDHLNGETSLKLCVSHQDFPDEAALTFLRDQVSRPTDNAAQAQDRIDIKADPALESGACIFNLQLGQLDASIPLQVSAADRLLEEFDQVREAAE